MSQRIVSDLREFQDQMDRSLGTAEGLILKAHDREGRKVAINQYEALSVEFDRKFKDALWGRCKIHTSEMLRRIGHSVSFAYPTNSNSRDNEKARDIASGSAMVDTGNLAGSGRHAEQVAIFLEFIAGQLPSR
jgi:hypothetical protein